MKCDGPIYETEWDHCSERRGEGEESENEGVREGGEMGREKERGENNLLEGNGYTVLPYNTCIPVTPVYFSGSVEYLEEEWVLGNSLSALKMTGISH